MSKLILPVLDRSPLHPALGVWLMMTIAGIPFRERIEKADGVISRPLVHVSAPLSETPVLYHGRRAVWGALGIMEYLAELFPDKNLWPKALSARTVARAVSYEIQSKLDELRKASITNAAGSEIWAEDTSLILKDKARIEDIIRECRAQFGRGGKFLFGRFSAPDAILAPILLLLEVRAAAVEPETLTYMNSVLSIEVMLSWREVVSAHLIRLKPSYSAVHAIR